MKITHIEVWRIAMPFDAGRRNASPALSGDAYNAASPALAKMESLLLKLTTDSGLSGWGEAFGHLCNPASYAALAGSVGRYFLGAELDGQPAGIAALMTRAKQAFHGFGATGPMMYALSAADTALWDLSAKQAGQPLYRLLGAQRSTIEAYASLPSYDNDPSEVAWQAARAAKAGFRKIKLHETSPEAIRAARDALPSEVELMVDVNCPWTRKQAAQIVDELADTRLGWLEEPIWPPDDLEGLAGLRGKGTRIAAGENASGLNGLLTHLQSPAVDILQPSVAKIGGVSAMLEALGKAREAGVLAIPHCFYYGAGLCATAHLVATLGTDILLELPFLEWRENLHPFLPVRPVVSLPDTPGLGFGPDDGMLEAWKVDHAVLC